MERPKLSVRTQYQGAVSGLPQDDLNVEQRGAVSTTSQHVLVKAGAGTGKTTTVIGRCAYLIDSGVEPSGIQVLTFTRRAALEVKERVEEQLSTRSDGLKSSTFHSWCMQLLRSDESLWGYAGWTVIDQDDQATLFKACRGQQTVTFPSAKNIASVYSFARNTGVGLIRSAQAMLGMEKADIKEKLLPIARAYEKRKKDNRYLDYDDILVIVGQQLGRSEELARWVGTRFPYLLVDEMQDTNPIQWDILIPLAPYTSLYCVGDDAQSIYGFRGASFDNIHHFQDVIPGSEVHGLTLNYRSTQEILDLSNWLLDQSPLNYDKKLVSSLGSGSNPRMYDFNDANQAALWISDEIEGFHHDGENLRENLVLSRTSWGARSVEGVFLRRGIPYRFYGGSKLMASAHIRDVLSALRVVGNPLDTLGWMRLLTLFPGIGDVTATDLMTQQISIVNHTGSPNYNVLPGPVKALLGSVATETTDVAAALDAAFEGMEGLLERRYRKLGWDRRANDLPILRNLAKGHSSILAFIEQYLVDPIEVSVLAGEPSEDAATIATIHSAKGMEADNVFLVNAGPGHFPSARSVDEGSVEEERRVLYVALTRARRRLVMTRTVRSRYVVDVSTSDPSDDLYFLADVPGHLCDMHSRVQIPGTLHGSPTLSGSLSPVDLDIEL